jgi:hypothetical protein
VALSWGGVPVSADGEDHLGATAALQLAGLSAAAAAIATEQYLRPSCRTSAEEIT